MSWMGSQLALRRCHGLLPHQADVELSEFREGIGFRWYMRWYMRPDVVKLPPEMLGETIDDCLVDFICLTLMRLKAGRYSAEQFKLVMDGVREGMSEDPDLKAYAVKLMRNKKFPLASETHMDLVIRHALYGGKPAPCVHEGSRFARVMLAPVMQVDFVETDMNQPIYSRLRADSWWRNPYPNDLLTLKQESRDNAAAWGALMLLCRYADETALKHLLPAEVLQWFLGASFGRPKRPGVKPAAPNRPSGLGYMLRNNEIRFTVDLLEQVACRERLATKPWQTSFIVERAQSAISAGSPIVRLKTSGWPSRSATS